MKRIYLDNNATTPVNREVLHEMMPYFSEVYGNPSTAYQEGQQARSAIDRARLRTAKALGGVTSDEIIFTGSGTEANNLAILGLFGAMRRADPGRKFHFITSTIEHNAILKICKELSSRNVEVSFVNVDNDGLIRIDELKSLIRDDTFLISIMTANNEIGTIQPVEAIGAVARERGVLFHTDAIQAVGKIPVAPVKAGIDMLSISGHKFYGPKGVGALYVRRGIKLEPVLFGGSQERGLRPGTENVPAIVGFGKAIEIAVRHLEENSAVCSNLIRRLESEIVSTIKDMRINGAGGQRVCNTLNVSFKGVEAEALVARLDLAGISAATGAACTTGATQTSHVLKAMNQEASTAYSAIRFSVGRYNTVEEIDQVVGTLAGILNEMRES